MLGMESLRAQWTAHKGLRQGNMSVADVSEATADTVGCTESQCFLDAKDGITTS